MLRQGYRRTPANLQPRFMKRWLAILLDAFRPALRLLAEALALARHFQRRDGALFITFVIARDPEQELGLIGLFEAPLSSAVAVLKAA